MSITVERKSWQHRLQVPSVETRLGPLEGTHLWFQVDTGNRNRLRPFYSWYDHTVLGIGLRFGNGNSDDVWTIALELHLPAWLARRLP